MLRSRILACSLFLGLPLAVLAASPFDRMYPPERAYPSMNPHVVLRQAEHAPHLARIMGIVRGMTHKLENLSQRLDNQSAAVDRRLQALREAGHTLTVDTELTALHDAITKAKDQITTLIAQLNAIPDSDHPGQVVPQVREMIRTVRTTLADVRAAFKKLRLAVRDDISPTP